MYLRSQWSKEPMVYPVIFDEREPWDMSHAQWGFPQSTAWMNGLPNGKLIHVGVFTNCDKVELYVNSSIPHIASPSPDDGIAHFMVANHGGSMRAVGYRQGEALCEHTISTSKSIPNLTLHHRKNTGSFDDQRIHLVEAVLTDELGQCMELDTSEITFSVQGAGRFLFQDNGNLTDPDRNYTSIKGHLYRGHTLCVVQTEADSGQITITAKIDGIETQELDIFY